MVIKHDKIINSNGDQASELDKVTGKLNDVKDEVADFVKKNPWAALAIAAGLGFILARLLSGKKD